MACENVALRASGNLLQQSLKKIDCLMWAWSLFPLFIHICINIVGQPVKQQAYAAYPASATACSSEAYAEWTTCSVSFQKFRGPGAKEGRQFGWYVNRLVQGPLPSRKANNDLWQQPITTTKAFSEMWLIGQHGSSPTRSSRAWTRRERHSPHSPKRSSERDTSGKKQAENEQTREAGGYTFNSWDLLVVLAARSLS